MTEPDVIRVVVADDQAIIRDGLVTVLSLLPDISIVGEAANGAEAVRVVTETRPDVVLMDLRMPVLDGVGATQQIVSAVPGTAILVLTTYADDASILGALRAGARGYLTKDAGRAEVAAAVRAVASGQTTLAAGVGDRVISSLLGGPGAADAPEPAATPETFAARFPTLTQRERDVLALLGEGLSNPEIAAALFVSVATVKTHINAIFAKLALRDRAQAIALVRS
ncbi:response regulator transcription factor [Leifsonia kafniensis]|uniref:Response regulator transcription factor n=1 Tax=Leifsonia kafniensis TaxID=475957 RepID=A0ABP7KXX3_9MICO